MEFLTFKERSLSQKELLKHEPCNLFSDNQFYFEAPKLPNKGLFKNLSTINNYGRLCDQ